MNENTDNQSPSVTTDNISISERPKQRILIGSQRNPDAYRLKPNVTVTVVDPDAVVDSVMPETKVSPDVVTGDVQIDNDVRVASVDVEPQPKKSKPKVPVVMEPLDDDEDLSGERIDGNKKSRKHTIPVVKPNIKIPVPNIRGKMSDDLEAEFDAIFAGAQLDSILESTDTIAGQDVIEPETKLKGTIIRQGREHVFLDINNRHEGTLALKMFPDDAVPKVGDVLDVVVTRFADGLYELTMPLAAADVHDWTQVHNDMVVDAVVTKANTGGLEVQVNRLRGFIPISQIAQFRVEKSEEFVGTKLTCVVIECDAANRNLVLSRRAMIERERAELREKTIAELEVGQIREGVVRKIIDVGAFIDLGGVDGFIHISALAWGRVRHPSDVLREGQHIKVKIQKIDNERDRISLTYRDDAENPWANIRSRFEEKATVHAKVTRLADFGVFVELASGVEGLIHISELSNKRIGSVGEIVHEGDWIDVMILSIDTEAKRIGLSRKQLLQDPLEKPDVADEQSEPELPSAPKQASIPPELLKGGIGKVKTSEGAKFGLKW